MNRNASWGASGYLLFFLAFLQLLAFPCSANQDRFPRPDFQSSYSIPDTVQMPSPSAWLPYFDLTILILVMALSAKFAIFDRSRRKVFFLSVFSLAYFGFWKKGCVCSVGSLQNISASIFSPDYLAPLALIAFFLLPILFALYFGRVFCASACPLGAIQDILVVKALKLPLWAREVFGLLPHLYLGLAVIYAATSSGFIICRADPFVSFFRLSGSSAAFLSGAVILSVSLFVARPYCRFICPYGVLLSFASLLSKWRLKITPSECIRCGICVQNCPFEAIAPPEPEKYPGKIRKDKKRLLFIFCIIPLIFVAFPIVFCKLSPHFAGFNPSVRLLKTLEREIAAKEEGSSLESLGFAKNRTSLDELRSEVRKIHRRFFLAAVPFGIYIAFVVSMRLVRLSIWRRRPFPEPELELDKCFVCSRCQQVCPMQVKITQSAPERTAENL